ncbi:MAG: hypothetical protein ACRYG7_12395 [Janthinobacterium lividum]
MPKIFTLLRLPLLAVVLSCALTSCFDHDKKCDPKPSNCAKKTTSKSGGDN